MATRCLLPDGRASWTGLTLGACALKAKQTICRPFLTPPLPSSRRAQHQALQEAEEEKQEEKAQISESSIAGGKGEAGVGQAREKAGTTPPKMAPVLNKVMDSSQIRGSIRCVRLCIWIIWISNTCITMQEEIASLDYP